MEFKGTPGPWRVVDNGTFFDVNAAGESSSLADTCGSQCAYDSGTHTKDGVAYANACLIAAAPDLFNALTGLLGSYKQLTDSGDAGFWKLEETTEGRAAMKAINKALGG